MYFFLWTVVRKKKKKKGLKVIHLTKLSSYQITRLHIVFLEQRHIVWHRVFLSRNTKGMKARVTYGTGSALITPLHVQY